MDIDKINDLYYQHKNKLLKEQAEGDEDSGEVFVSPTELEKWEKKYPLPNGYNPLTFYFDKRMDEDEIDTDYMKAFEDPIIHTLVKKYTSKTEQGHPTIEFNSGKWTKGFDDIFDYLYNLYHKTKEYEYEAARDEEDRQKRIRKIQKTHGKDFDDWSQFDTQGEDDHGL